MSVRRISSLFANRGRMSFPRPKCPPRWRWPLTLWVCCYGAWCDSDGRTRSIWPISVRVPVSEAERRLNRVWQVLTEQRGEPLPLTASRDEAFEFDHCDGRARPGNVEGDQPMTRLKVVEKTKGF